MTGTLPNEDQVDLIICDDVRPEVNNKVTLAGFFPAAEVNVRDVGEQFGLPLCFVVVVRGGEGELRMAMKIRRPDGQLHFETPSLRLAKAKDRPALQVIKILNFRVPTTGEYAVEIQLDERAYNRRFKVGHDPSIKAGF